MAKKGNRKHVILRSPETGHTYHTTKNKRMVDKLKKHKVSKIMLGRK